MSPKASPGRQQQTDSVLMSWVGHRVVVKYLSGPNEPADPGDEKGLVRGELEARSGVFQLRRFGQIGIEVANTLEDSANDRVTLIPWSAILSLRGTTPAERGGADSRLSREQVADLSRNDPTLDRNQKIQRSPILFPGLLLPVARA